MKFVVQLKRLFLIGLLVHVAHARVEFSSSVSSIDTIHNGLTRLTTAGADLYPLLTQVEDDGTTRLTETEQETLLAANSSALDRLQLWMDTRVGTTTDFDAGIAIGPALIGEKTVAAGWSRYGPTTSINWHPSGKYLSVSAYELTGTKKIFVYSFNATYNSFSLLSYAQPLSAGAPFLGAWSPDGNYFAGEVGAASGNQEISCLYFDGVRFFNLSGCGVEIAAFGTGSLSGGVSWSPSGQFVVYPDGINGVHRIFAFDRVRYTLVATIGASGTPGGAAVVPSAAAWSPNGKFIAVSQAAGGYGSKIYAWNNGSPVLVDTTLPAGSDCDYSLAWSPDGNYLACGGLTSPNIYIHRFDGARATLIASYTLPGSWALIDTIAWSQDGKYLFAGYASNTTWDVGKIKVLSFKNEQLKPLNQCDQTTNGGVAGLSIHPTLPIIATLSAPVAANLVVQTWKFEPGTTGRPERLTELVGCSKTSPTANVPNFNCVKWSPDGRYVATCEGAMSSVGKMVWVYEFIGGSLVLRASFDHGDYVNYLSWHPSGKYIAIAGKPSSGITARVLKFEGSSLRALAGCDKTGASEFGMVDWHPSGNYLAVATFANYTVQVFSFANEALTLLATTPSHAKYVYCVAWHPSGNSFVMGDEYNGTDACNLRLYKFDGANVTEVTTARYAHGIAGSRVYYNVQWSSDGKYLAIAGHNGDPGAVIEARVVYFNGSSFTTLSNAVTSSALMPITSVSWLKGTTYLGVTWNATGTHLPFRLFNFDGSALTEIDAGIPSFSGRGLDIAFSPDGKYVAIAGGAATTDAHLVVYPVLRGLSLQDRQCLSDTNNVAQNANLALIATSAAANSNAILSLYRDAVTDVTGYASLASTMTTVLTSTGVNAVAWSPDGRRVAIGTDSIPMTNFAIYPYMARQLPQFSVYDHSDDNLSLMLNGTWDFGISATVTDVAWHPQGNYVAVAAGVLADYAALAATSYGVYLFEVQPTGLKLTTTCAIAGDRFGRDIQTIEAVEWSPDGKFLIAAGYGPLHQAYIYGFDYRQTFSLLSSLTIDFGNASTVYDVAWHPAGQHIALVGAGGANRSKIRIHTFEPLSSSLDGYLTWTCAGGVYSGCDPRQGVAWSPDGSKLAAVGAAGVLGAELMLFDFYPTTSVLHHLGYCDFTHGNTLASVSWSPDSLSFAVTGTANASNISARLFKLDKATRNYLTEVTAARVDDGINKRAVAFRPDGCAIALGGEIDVFNIGVHLKKFAWQSLHDYTHTSSQSLGGLMLSNSNVLDYWKDTTAGALDALCRATNDAITKYSTLDPTTSDAILCTRQRVLADSYAITAQSWYINEVAGSNASLLNLPTTADDFIRHAWCGPVLAVVNANVSDSIRTYRFNGSSFTQLDSEAHGATITDLAWHPTGNYLAVCGAAGTGSYTLRVYSVANGVMTQVGVVANATTDARLAWHPSGLYLAVLSSTTATRLYAFDPSTGTLTTTPVETVDHGASGQAAIAWRPDGKYLFTGGVLNATDSTQTRLYYFKPDTVGDGVQLIEITGCRSNFGGTSVSAAAWQKRGDFLAIGYTGGTNQLKLASFNGTALTQVSQAYGNDITSLCWSSSGQYIAAVTATATANNMRLYRIRDGQLNEVAAQESASRSWQGVGFTYDDQFVSVSGASDFACYPLVYDNLVENNSWAVEAIDDRVAGLTTLQTHNATYGSPSINTRLTLGEADAITNSNNLLTIADFGYLKNRLDIDEALTLANSNSIVTLDPLGVANSNLLVNLNSLEIANSNVLVAHSGAMSEIVNLLPYTTPSPAPGGRIWRTSWSPDGRYLGGAGEDGTLYIYKRSGSNLTQVASAVHGAPLRGVHFHPTGRYIVTCGDLSGSIGIRVYRFDNETLSQVSTVATGVAFGAVRWHPNGLWLAAETSPAIYVGSFDPTTGTLGTMASLISGLSTGYYGLNWSPNGNYIAFGNYTASDQHLLVCAFSATPSLTIAAKYTWGTSTGGGGIWGLGWSPSGEYLAFTVYSGTVTAIAATILKFDGTSLVWRDTIAANAIGSGVDVVFSPDGKYLAMTGTDSTLAHIRIAKVGLYGKLTEITAARRLPGTCLGCAFSPDMSAVVCGATALMLTLYPITYTSLIANNSWAVQSLNDAPALALRQANSTALNNFENVNKRLSNDSWGIIRNAAQVFPSGYASPSRVYENSWAVQRLNSAISSLEPANSSAIVSFAGRMQADSTAVISIARTIYDFTNSTTMVRANSNAEESIEYSEVTDSNLLVAHSWAMSEMIGLNASLPVDTAPANAQRNVSWSRDGRYLALAITTGTTNDVQVYRRDAMQMTLVASANPGAPATDVDWHPSGRYLAVSATTAPFARVYRFVNESLTSIWTYNVGGSFNVRWSPSGNHMLFANSIGVIYAVPFTASTETVGTPVNLGSCSSSVRGLSWHPTGLFFAVSGSLVGGFPLRVYSFNPSVPSMTLVTSDVCRDAGYAHNVDWTPDGNYLAAACYTGSFTGGILFKFNGTTLTETANFSTTTACGAVRASHDGNYVTFVAAGSSKIKVFRINRDGSWTEVDGMLLTGVFSLSCFSPDDALLAVATNAAQFFVYPIKRQSLIAANSSAIVKLKPLESYDNSGIAAHSHFMTTITTTGDALVGCHKINGADLYDVTWSPTGRYLCAVGAVNTDNVSGRIYTFAKVPGTLTELPYARLYHGSALYSSDWHPSGNYIAVGGADGIGGDAGVNVRVFSFTGTSATDIATCKVNAGGDQSTVVWSPNGNFLAAANAAGAAPELRCFWFMNETLTEITGCQVTHGGALNAAAWHPSGNYLAVGGAGVSSVNLRLLTFTGNAFTALTTQDLGSGEVVRTLAWSPNGNYLAVGMEGASGNNKIRVFSFNGSILTSVAYALYATTDGKQVRSVVWSADGTRLFASGYQGDGNYTTRTYAFDGIDLIELPFARYAHGANLYGAALSPANDYYAVCGVAQFSINARVYAVPLSNMITANSNAVVALIQREVANSNALVAFDSLIANNSNLVVNEYNQIYPNGYAQVSLPDANSNSIVTLNRDESFDASAAARTDYEVWPNGHGNPSRIYENHYAVLSNSDKIITTDVRFGAVDSSADNIAAKIVLLDGRITADEGTIATQDGQITTLQTDANELEQQTDTIDTNVAHLWFSGSMTLTYNLNLGLNHKLNLNKPVGGLTLNGAGHHIVFPWPAVAGALTLANNTAVTMQVTRLENFSEDQVTRGAGSSLVFGSGTTVALGGDQTLTKQWRFGASCALDGRGATLTLGTGGSISIEGSPRCTISNLTIANLSQYNFTCDATSHVRFENVKLIIPSIYHFATGSFDIYNSIFECAGPGIFSYESIEASTINVGSEWLLSAGVTLSYAPTNTFDNRIYFSDATAKLHLDNATLVATYTGLNLNTGTLVLSGHNYANVSTVIDDDGVPLSFGTGDVNKNLYISVSPGGSLDIVRGFLDYRNVEALS